MRLLKPSLFSSLPFYKENDSNICDKILLEESFNVKENNDINLDTNFSLTDLLILPQSFGNIFIGEIFSSYICIHNHALVNVTQLSVKVELQTKTQKFPLQLQSSSDEYVQEFNYDQTFDAIIHHAVKELGVHV
jgi:trafficking protein particle complex subunit 13